MSAVQVMSASQRRELCRLRALHEPSRWERFVWWVSKPRMGLSHFVAAALSVGCAAWWLG